MIRERGNSEFENTPLTTNKFKTRSIPKGTNFVWEPGIINAINRNKVKIAQKSKNDDKRGNERWKYYNSSANSYEKTFRHVLNGKSLGALVEEKKSSLIVDLMAPSGTLVNLFETLPEDPSRQGFAVNLRDDRSDFQKDRDKRLGITQLTADLSVSKGWRLLKEELAGRKADLIIERGFGGLEYLPKHPFFYRYALQQSWANLNNEGIMLFQNPGLCIVNITKIVDWQKAFKDEEEAFARWKEMLKRQHIKVDSDPYDNTLLMVRSPQSPQTLPSILL